MPFDPETRTLTLRLPEELVPEAMRGMSRPTLTWELEGAARAQALRELFERFRDGGTFEEFQRAVDEIEREIVAAVAGTVP